MSSTTHPNHPSNTDSSPSTADRNTGDIKEPPYHEQAERSVIGAIFLDQNAYFEEPQKLRPKHFYRESHRKIWRALETLIDEDRDIDVITVGEQLELVGELDKVGGPNVLVRLSNEVPSSANVGEYVRIVREKYRLRHVIKTTQNATRDAYRGRKKPDIIESELAEALQRGGESSSTRTTTKETDKRLGEMMTSPEAHARTYSTGIGALDLATRQFVAMGRTTYWGALSKMGKTSACIAVTEHLLTKHDFAVDWWSVEMPATDIEARFISNMSGVPFDEVWSTLQDGQGSLKDMEPERLQKIQKAREVFRALDMEIEFRGRPHVRDIELETRARYHRLPEHRKDRFALVVDYVQVCVAGNETSNRYADLAEVAMRLNGLVKDLGIFGMFLVQFDKAADKRFAHKGKRPRFSDIRGLSQAGNDANHQLVLHRPYRDRQNEDAKFTKIFHELSRHGGMGNVAELELDEDLCRLQSWRGDRPTDDGSTGADPSRSWQDHSGQFGNSF
ncbi:MAG: replicative DNA helicase [Trueperaceae bacterium]|nr:replicative DNA helicase [Trueperaceae bacterium]